MRILKKLHGMDGKWLSRSNAAILRALIVKPDATLWRKARNMVICDQPLITLSAAVQAVANGQVVIAEFPDTFTIYRALNLVVDKRQRCFHQMEVCDNES